MICKKCGKEMQAVKRSGERFTRSSGDFVEVIVDRHHEFECSCHHKATVNFEHLIHRIKRRGHEEIDRQTSVL